MDTAGSSSREADKISQLAARTHAYGERARIYMECTVSTEQGRTWREITGGTDSRIVLPCPHCGGWVTPGRQHLVGWSEAADVVEAGEKALLACPSCGTGWSEPERAEANRQGRLVHRDQEIDPEANVTGQVVGTRIQTRKRSRMRTRGFRFEQLVALAPPATPKTGSTTSSPARHREPAAPAAPAPPASGSPRA